MKEKLSVPLPSSDIFKRRISVLWTESSMPWSKTLRLKRLFLCFLWFQRSLESSWKAMVLLRKPCTTLGGARYPQSIGFVWKWHMWAGDSCDSCDRPRIGCCCFVFRNPVPVPLILFQGSWSLILCLFRRRSYQFSFILAPCSDVIGCLRLCFSPTCELMKLYISLR